ncbi:MAG TPA: hypothetical protein VN736_21815 [Candidatus Limnocylindrales bacterium]|nr:hypothetical protein [Candidatus Limnocylindrales bacterium]
MTVNLRKVLVILAGFGACVIAAWVTFSIRQASPGALLRRLPAGGALVLSVDFAALRNAGILNLLGGAGVGEDPEYQAFVQKTKFNYKQDLDLALAAFGASGKYMLLKGRFDWNSLEAYARAQGGGCADGLCKMQGSTPDRKISFFKLQSGVMALAVSPDDGAALRMKASGPERTISADQQAPVWLQIPPSALKSGENLPDGTLPFAHTVDSADTILLAFQPEGKGLAAKLDVVCRSEQDAIAMSLQLTKITGLLKRMIEAEHQHPNPADFSGVLTSGSFRSQGNRVYGYWPIDKSFVANLAANEHQ